ncbi:hypothetical protein F3157_01045 [Virgibacillus dakarensis]|uniref:DUF945 domain-containing protein n=1 Tax=Lentibacillus populi TaxID=1827502 RepID=A0A9W5TUS0_9BACI|nr:MULTISPECIES: DUF6583 family protein [Bacillaceae]MTW84256.1 hypothetical protein [Virgibacillus dakarensis]GGB27851.1 hypothetical protein GCM10011409_01440 [Lentibacillus populi]
MDETQNGEQTKKGLSKKLIAIIVVAVLLVGGGVAAYVTVTGSDKAQYFKAEKNTIDFMKDKITERYEPELAWREQTEENPIETTFKLSGEYNDPYGGGYGMMDPQEIINNATLTLTSQTDLKEKQLVTDIQANFGEMEMKDMKFYIDADKLLLGLPFLKESLQIKDKDIGKLLHEADPSFPEGETIDFNTFFELVKGLPEEDLNYLKEEYATKIFDEIPGDAFDSAKETIKVDNKNFDTEKITMHLSEQETKDLFVSILEKMQDDKKLQKLFKEQMELRLFGISPEAMDLNFNEDIDKLFGEDLDKLIKDIKDSHIPNGLTSIIWVKNNLIVQRDFSIGAGGSKDEINTLTIKGTHLLNDTTQKFDYEITADDSINKGTVTFTGDLSWKDNKANDSIKLAIEDVEYSYEGTETLKDDRRDYERVFSVSEPGGDISFNWSGKASYDKDKMNSENTFAIDAPALNVTQDMASLHVKKDAKTIKKVNTPDDSNVKDIGSMSVNEIMNYFETDVAPQYQQWLMGILGAGGGGDLNGL